MTSATFPKPQSSILSNLWAWIKRIPPIYPVFILIYIGVGFLNPNFTTGDGILVYLRRSAPTIILTIGQLFVLATGGFDLSQGSLVTLTVIGGAMLIANDPANVPMAIGVLLLIGLVVGLVNGLIVSYLKVPSFIVTLGMLLIIKGLGMYWCNGSPKGYLTDNFRALGRGYIENLPLVGRFPYAVIILLVLGIAAFYLFHRANLGRSVLAIGDNQITSRLSGVKVHKVRIIAFVLSALFATIAGILLGGFAGVNVEAGTGLELVAISAAVLGGTALGGGRGSVPSVIVGALTLEALFSLLNLLGLPKTLRDAVQGLIIIGAAAYIAYNARKRR